ncbi:hypothetical protein pb186bvf_021061, partial [Paramecium bursaria]
MYNKIKQTKHKKLGSSTISQECQLTSIAFSRISLQLQSLYLFYICYKSNKGSNFKIDVHSLQLIYGAFHESFYFVQADLLAFPSNDFSQYAFTNLWSKHYDVVSNKQKSHYVNQV